MPYEICVSIGNVKVDEYIALIKANKMAEIRLDLMDIAITNDDIKKIFSSSNNLIATCRASKDFDDEKRFKVLCHAIDAGAKYVDVEVDASDDFKEKIITYLRSKSKKLIISYHNFEKTPSREELEHTVEWCKSYKPDLIKTACLSHSKRDNARLLSLIDCDTPMIVIGMGKEGRATRFLAPLLGAFCSFASPEGYAVTAPGQVTSKELEAFLGSYKG